MLEKYKKLIISQLCAIFAIGAGILAFLRYQQTPVISDPTFMSFVFFAILLLVMEIKLIVGWINETRKSKI